MCKNIAYEFYCEELIVVKHKSKCSFESAIYFNLGSETIKKIVTSLIILIIPISIQYYLMVETKLFWQIGPMTNILNVTSIMIFLSRYPSFQFVFIKQKWNMQL